MRTITLGLLAHVDAGKTTLAEALLFRAGQIRIMGRVDHGSSHLDVDAMERARGITIFSKHATFEVGDLHVSLLDTPGHVDFSAEMERSLSALDCAVLVVSALDGVQGHTETLWHLLDRAGVPTFVFVNKMDLAFASRNELLDQLNARFEGHCLDFSAPLGLSVVEAAACTDEAALEEFFETGTLSHQRVRELVVAHKVVPCLFGSALKLEGVDELLACLDSYASEPPRSRQFAARVFKVTHDGQGNRLAWLKLTGGELAVKDQLTGALSVLRARGFPEVASAGATPGCWAEKVNQIRIYEGAKFTAVDRVRAGQVCAVTGLTQVRPGDVLGAETALEKPLLVPVLSYGVLPGACDVHRVCAALCELAKEDPLLGVAWNEQLQEIRLQLMGPIQLEVVRQILRDRFGFDVSFGPGGIAYRETVAAPVVGVGHFEPLRHYAEVHLLIEPLPAGSGLVFGTACDENELDRNWQRLFLTNAMEREHLGTLVGAPLTDARITLLTGATHPKHTQGGDCRQATYRAIRQGLMQARERGDAVLLEPWYAFRLEVPQELVGRAITDVQAMCGSFGAPQSDGTFAVLEGEAPVATMQEYAVELGAYTRGRGRLRCTLKGYAPCHNAEEVVAAASYDPASDMAHTPDSVFCSHGAGYTVKWDAAPAAMHLQHDVRGSAPWRLADAAFFSSGAR